MRSQFSEVRLSLVALARYRRRIPRTVRIQDWKVSQKCEHVDAVSKSHTDNVVKGVCVSEHVVGREELWDGTD